MRSRRRLLWILLAAVIALLLVAVIAGALYLALQRRPTVPAGWQDPVASIEPNKITAGLALYPLAGASELETVDVALDSGDLETAYAALVFSRDLVDVRRIGRLTLLGRGFVEAGEPQRAHLCFQQIYDLALLSPSLNDPARADALLNCGKGWASIEQTSQARNAFEQVYTLAVQSPYLQMAHRRDLLGALEAAYRDLGDVEQAEAFRQQIAELDQQAQPQPPQMPGELPDLPVSTESISSPEIGELEEARRQAAYALIEALDAGGEPPSDLVQGLARSLHAEDAAKLDLYRQELEATSQPGRRINVHWHTIRWLTIKHQVAVKGFGLSLVPDWEAQAADVQSALTKAYEDLFFDYEDLVAALPEASLIGPGSYQARRLVLLAGRLGHYPNFPAQQMASKLQDVVTDLIATESGEQLYVDMAVADEGLRFFLSPAEQYGQPARLP
jgi:hypothetical protein